MTPDQLDFEIEELSTRMERVRSLYEQYFMGIERLEPTIPRKDVERRIQVLRKIRFQNTAKRFKFQTLVQRYNSLQQYWNRTCRDIDNGTYKRHLLKAERRFGVTKGAPGADGQAQSTEANDSAAPGQEHPAEKAAAARERASHDLASLLDSDTDLDQAMSNVLAEFEKKPAPISPAVRKNDEVSSGDRITNTGLLGRLGKSPEGAPVQETAHLTKTSPSPAGLKGLPPLKRSGTSPEPLKPLPKTASGRSEPPRPTRRSERPPEAAAGPLQPKLASKPPAHPARPQTTPGLAGLTGLASKPPARPARPQTTPGLAGVPLAGLPPLPKPVAPSAAVLPKGNVAPSPTGASSTAGAPSPAAPPPRVPPPRTTTLGAGTPLAGATAVGAASPLGSAATGTAAPRPAPPPARPPAAARPAAPAQPSAAQPTAPAQRRSVPPRPGPSAAQLSEDRIKALHQSYVDARRQTNASTVSLEKLAQSLRETEQKLRQKHVGRAIDFDVSIKDGKAILTPKLK